MQKETKINIPSNIFFQGGQILKIDNSKRQFKILVGLGMLNSEDELSINLPLDFLMIIESLKILKALFESKNLSLYITIWIGDKNAEIILKEKKLFSEENKKLWNCTRHTYYSKIKKIMKNSGFEENDWNIFFGSDLYENEEYKAYCAKLSENTKFLDDTTCYSKEQLFVMHYYKNLKGYDYRLSWSKNHKKHRNYNERDEKGCDNEYIETFNQQPIESIFIRNGFKLSDDMGGLGVAVPYSYFPSELGNRIPLDENTSLDDITLFLSYLNDKNIKKYESIYGKDKLENENLSEAIHRKIVTILKE
jgi:hypothetical protein